MCPALAEGKTHNTIYFTMKSDALGRVKGSCKNENSEKQDNIQFIPVLGRNIGRAICNIDAHSERARFLKKLSFVRA